MGKTSSISSTRSSWNTFRDLGVPQPELAKIKSDIAPAIFRAIENRNLTQAEAAIFIGVDQAKFSAIIRGITKGYSVERLMVFLNRLDIDVIIRLEPKPRRSAHGQTRVTHT